VVSATFARSMVVKSNQQRPGLSILSRLCSQLLIECSNVMQTTQAGLSVSQKASGSELSELDDEDNEE
jgi:hypothetical protein